MRLVLFLVLPVLFSTTSVTDLIPSDGTKVLTARNSGLPRSGGVIRPWKTSKNQPVTLSVLVWYLGPHNGYVEEILNSTHLPLPGYNVSTGAVHIVTLFVKPTFSRLKMSYGGSHANSVSPALFRDRHPLGAISSFLNPVLVFSTILMCGSIIAVMIIFSYAILVFVWIVCSYGIGFIQPYPYKARCGASMKSILKPAGHLMCTFAEQTIGGTATTLISLVIDHFLPFNQHSIVCGPATVHLSTLLILFSGIFITFLCVDLSMVTSCPIKCTDHESCADIQRYPSQLQYGGGTTIFVRNIDGKVAVYNNIREMKQLKCCIHENTGIPPEFQRLYFGRKLITDSTNLVNDIPCGSNLNLMVHLKGGGNNYCEICYEKGEYQCTECDSKIFCSDCCTKYHKHPSRSSHKHIIALNSDQTDLPECSDHCHSDKSTHNDHDDDCHLFEDNDSGSEFDISDTPNTSSFFQEASMVMTLAERFNLTRFKEYQKDAILALLSGRDCLIAHPTGSGKSLCFTFPAVYENKKTIVVSPTISLMMDQVKNCDERGIKATYLGSAQLDLSVEDRVLSSNSDTSLIFVTPEWIVKPDKKAKVQRLAQNRQLCMIAIDEAHLYHYWQEFRAAYKQLENLKDEFPSTPIACLTATAPPLVQESILKLLRNPFITKGSINRPNITLSCEALPSNVKRKDFSHFASRVSNILDESQSAIIYTDFIDDVGPIMSKLNEEGIESVAYYGEMDIRSRSESYTRWRNGEVNVIVATSAFGMGINKPDIRHVIRFGVPENLCSWAQELGRAGRDGEPAKATIFYHDSHIEHAGAWIKGKIGDFNTCERILNEFSESWKYVTSNLVWKCRRAFLLESFGEPTSEIINGTCCDICSSYEEKAAIDVDYTDELKTLYNAIETIGSKGEVKIAQWIRGSSLSWTDNFNKQSVSYGNAHGHNELWWRLFIRRCHVLGTTNKQLKSIIKQSQHYCVQGVICTTAKGYKMLDDGERFVIPTSPTESRGTNTATCKGGASRSRNQHTEKSTMSCKPARLGKGTHSLGTIKRLLLDKENWKVISDKSEYQFPGVFLSPQMQSAYYTDDCTKLPQSCALNNHFLWDDIQVSKGSWNKDREITVTLDEKVEKLVYRVAPCNGVKVCPQEGCDYVAPVSAQRPCSKHQQKLIKSNEASSCPVQFAYIYPSELANDHRRWIFAFVLQQKCSTTTLHNHPMHSSTKVSSFVKESILKAAKVNPSLKPFEISRGKGLTVVPGVIDEASNHMGRLAREVKKAKSQTLAGSTWNVYDFEDIADKVDTEDENVTGNAADTAKISKICRPYLVSAGLENGIKFIFCANPLMTDLLSKSEFVEADITYNETREYPYLFNMVAFNYTTMSWMVVSRVRLTRQTADAYALAFTKTFANCKDKHVNFQPGNTLLGVVIDWCDAEINGLGKAVGKDTAVTLLRGCNVHWIRSWQRVRDRVCSSDDSPREKKLFGLIASNIQKLPKGSTLCNAFEVLCKQKSAVCLIGRVKGFTNDDAKFIDNDTDWSAAKRWAEWWMRSEHLRMLSKDYSEMDNSVWDRCPSDTNAVERKNKDSKEQQPQQLQNAMINLYKLDKASCSRHLAALNGSSIAYYSQTTQARRKAADKRNTQRQSCSSRDKEAVHGPPDRQCHFTKKITRKRSKPKDTSNDCKAKRPRIAASKRPDLSIDSSISDDDFETPRPSDKDVHSRDNSFNSYQYTQPDPKYLGKKIKMKFNVGDSSPEYQWYSGQILNYDPASGKYGAYFPSDGQTVFIDPIEEAEDIDFV